MSVQVGGLQTDPDSIDYEIALFDAITTKELVVDTTNFVIKLTQVRNLTRDGIVLKTLYSKLKEIWKSDDELIKLPFPMEPITDEQYDFINGWNFDKTVNTTTKLSVPDCSGSAGLAVINTTSSFFTAQNGAGQVVGLTGNYAVVGEGVAAGARVISVVNANEIILDKPNVGPVSGTLEFFSKVDLTYNLIRTGGWAVKNQQGESTEEWAGFLTLGELGAQRVTLSLETTEQSVNSNVVTLTDTTGIALGSFVAAPGVFLGTIVTEVLSSTQIRVNRTITLLESGATVTIRPLDRIWYQISDDPNVYPEEAVLHGSIDQAIQIFGNESAGDFDYRNPAIAKVFTRQEGYTYDEATIADIGVSTLTYQVYRFSITSRLDVRISKTDGEISSNGVVPTSTPYSDMTITWYDEPQPRLIGDEVYNFNIIIDADTTANGFGKASIEEIYEFVQWSLRRRLGVDIDAGVGSRIGITTRELIRFEANTLFTIFSPEDGGVYIDNFKQADINRFVFSDGQNRRFPFISVGNLEFDNNFILDGIDSKYTVFYKQINQQRLSATFKGFCNDTTLTVTDSLVGRLEIGDRIVGLLDNTVITEFVTGTGREGTYIISKSQTVEELDLFAYRGTSLKFGSNNAVIIEAFSSELADTELLTGSLNLNQPSIGFGYNWDKNTQCSWIPANRYRIDDEYRIETESGDTEWYRVTSDYTSGDLWESIVDGINSETIAGPTAVAVAVGTNNAQYFSQEFVIARSDTITVNVIAAAERNYSGS